MASLEKRAKDSRQQVSMANTNSNVALFSLNLKVLQLEKFTNGIREIVNFEHQSTKSQVLELNFRGGFGFFQEDQYKNNGIFNQITVLLSLLASVL